MSELIKKVFDLKALDVDTKTKQVKIAISQLESKDRDDDIFDPNAYDKTIKENGPKGTNEIWHLLDHTPRSFSALSKFKELGKEGKYIVGVSTYKNSFAWREVAWPLYEAGDITQHSVGFEILKADERDNKGIRIIKEVRLYEGSAVLWGANPDTPTMQVVKGLLNVEEDSEMTAAEKIEQLIKQIKKGRYEDDQSLLLVELKRLQSLFDTGNISKIFELDKISHTKEFNNEDKMFLKKMIPHHEMAIKMSKEIDSESDLYQFAQGIIKAQSSEIEQMKKWLGNKNTIQETTKEATEPGTALTLPEVVECPSCKKNNYTDDKGYVKCRGCGKTFVPGCGYAMKF